MPKVDQSGTRSVRHGSSVHRKLDSDGLERRKTRMGCAVPGYQPFTSSIQPTSTIFGPSPGFALELTSTSDAPLLHFPCECDAINDTEWGFFGGGSEPDHDGVRTWNGGRGSTKSPIEVSNVKLFKIPDFRHFSITYFPRPNN